MECFQEVGPFPVLAGGDVEGDLGAGFGVPAQHLACGRAVDQVGRAPGGAAAPRPRPAGPPPRSCLHEDDLIGLISLRRRTPTMGTISYILRDDSWGNGYATHAAHQVVTVAFTTAGLNRLEAMHHPDNPASGRVLAKAGFTRIGTADRDTETATVPYELYALESGA
ncbi:GNAT family N-acetyltransferase [Streptomyces sp. NPDC060002]|uniref:GNAT family N-acetyltransferase n=1 Tax=Streptomyces sp. NPDC060002 TaxID=3347033 RepID=UPI00367453C8